MNELVNKYNNLLVNLDSLNVVSLTADHIDAGTIDANVVTIKSDLAAGAYVQIDGNGMIINDGTQDTFEADINGHVTMTGATIQNNLTGSGFTTIDDTGIKINDGTKNTFVANSAGQVTMTGALVQSSTGYPAVIMDPSTELFGAYLNANNYIQIEADYGSVPSLNFVQGGDFEARIDTALGYLEIQSLSSLLINSKFGTEILVEGSSILTIPSFGKVESSTGQNLGVTLDSKATSGVSTGPSGGHNHGIPDGTVLMVSGGGTVTFSAVANHTHAQI